MCWYRVFSSFRNSPPTAFSIFLSSLSNQSPEIPTETLSPSPDTGGPAGRVAEDDCEVMVSTCLPWDCSSVGAALVLRVSLEGDKVREGDSPKTFGSRPGL